MVVCSCWEAFRLQSVDAVLSSVPVADALPAADKTIGDTALLRPIRFKRILPYFGFVPLVMAESVS